MSTAGLRRFYVASSIKFYQGEGLGLLFPRLNLQLHNDKYRPTRCQIQNSKETISEKDRNSANRAESWITANKSRERNRARAFGIASAEPPINIMNVCPNFLKWNEKSQQIALAANKFSIYPCSLSPSTQRDIVSFWKPHPDLRLLQNVLFGGKKRSWQAFTAGPLVSVSVCYYQVPGSKRLGCIG